MYTKYDKEGDDYLENLANYLRVKYELNAVQWQNDAGDKGQYSLLFYQMLDALESLYTCNNTYVRVAIHRAIAEDEMRLQDILRRVQ